MNNLPEYDKVQKKAYENYKNSTPWPSNDYWHECTYTIIEKYVTSWIKKNIKKNKVCLNIGSGTTKYCVNGKLIQMDIVRDYIEEYENHIVGSLEQIPLEDKSVDYIICVGSVLNYCDAIKAISEINRVLKENGRAILEFERSNSAEFLLNKNYGDTVFLKKYNYNNQEHLLWMYNENYIKKILAHNNFKISKIYRFHILSSLVYRLGFNENKSSKYYRFDDLFQFLSYPLAHNVMIDIIK